MIEKKLKEEKRPLILLTNDDGIFAPGLRKLIEIVRPLGDVVVVAPDRARSGQSHSITVRDPLRLKQIISEPGFEEYSCNGTPVDAVKLGEMVILNRMPDLLVSGINHGSNASVNIVYSGTMAAAIEGCIDGIPSIGFSLLDYSHDASFEGIEQWILPVIRNVLENGLPEGVCLNVNVPAVPFDQIKGLRVCRQAKGRWVEAFDHRIDPYQRNYYWLTGRFETEQETRDTDSWALANNWVSVVPIHYDFTAHHALNDLSHRDWNGNNQ
ncbi:MAG: 5'/3'-nucleotidase SurE [Bacteroidales bacterium]